MLLAIWPLFSLILVVLAFNLGAELALAWFIGGGLCLFAVASLVGSLWGIWRMLRERRGRRGQPVTGGGAPQSR